MLNPTVFNEKYHQFRNEILHTQIQLNSRIIDDQEISLEIEPIDDADYHSFIEGRCRAAVSGVIRLLLSAADSLNLINVQTELQELRKTYDTPDLDLGIIMNQWRPPFQLAFLDKTDAVADLLFTHLGGPVEQWSAGAEGALNNILMNTSIILNKDSVFPATEPQIVSTMYPVVKLAFPDALPDRSISFQGRTKTYQPDMAIPSIGICVEYKFATNNQEYAKEVDEIITDIINYGDATYKKFVAVMCATHGVLREQADFFHDVTQRLAPYGGITDAWQFVFVRVPGARKQQKGATTANASGASSHSS